MPLHPQAEAWLQAAIDARIPPLDTMAPEEARLLRMEQRVRWNLQPDPHIMVENRTVPGPVDSIPIRVYRPKRDPPHSDIRA